METLKIKPLKMNEDGKVIKKIKEYKNTDSPKLLEILLHLIGARAIREYEKIKNDPKLEVEINLIKEEFLKRLKRREIEPLIRVNF